ncbi:universal stress protein [Methylobacter tundripaludum]|uniref:universal stress protein n=1 Tax=Methylobacter tundripaludum TaxID=173365 RepID=UPI0004DEE1E2|nr:universal stress protein [Methylobacter tundripaludum]
MFSKIIVGSSLSEVSFKTLYCLKGLRQAETQKVILVHAINIQRAGSLYNQLLKLADPILEEQKKILEEMGFSVEIEVLLGSPHYEINRLAREKNVSLIAVHMTAESLIDDAFAGGVAYEVIQHAEKPVLVMKAKTGAGQSEMLCQEILSHIIYPTDFSDNAERAFTYVEELVESGCSKVTLLHVQEKERIDKYLKDRLAEFNAIDQARLERLKERLINIGAHEVSIEIPYGSATQEILREVNNNPYSLIVMGSQGRGFISEVFLGSVSHNIVRKAPVPVLLVPAIR